MGVDSEVCPPVRMTGLLSLDVGVDSHLPTCEGACAAGFGDIGVDSQLCPPVRVPRLLRSGASWTCKLYEVQLLHQETH